jgi:hypothetical protein
VRSIIVHPYIYSEAELKRLLAAVPAAAGPYADIDADTLRTFVLLLYGAALRRGEARRDRGIVCECKRSDFVVTLLMAWSPVRRFNAG